MAEKDIFRISIIGRAKNELDVRCDVDERFNKIIVGIIAKEMELRPDFKKCMLNEINNM